MKVMPVAISGFDTCTSDIKSKMEYAGSDVESEKEILLEEAAREAEEIKDSAYKQGMEEGHREGFEKGYEEAKRSIERELKIIVEIKAGLESYKEEILKLAEKEIVMLGIALSEKIIRQRIAEDDNIVIDTLRVALKSVSHLDKLIIHLNPEDYSYMNNKQEEIKEIISRYKEIKFIDDKRIEKGGCIIETEVGDIDTQPSNQLKKISSEILEEADKNLGQIKN